MYPCGYRGNVSLGKFSNLEVADIAPGKACTECDWECFRDPSALFSPMADSMNRPLRLMREFAGDPAYFRHWLGDVRYYRTCGYFDGREAPDYGKLARWA
mgnify:CR=1 FL=1